MQLEQCRIAGEVSLPQQSREQVASPLGQVHDSPGHTFRVKAQTQDIDRRLEQPFRAVASEQVDGRIMVDELPPPVDHECGIGLVTCEDLTKGGKQFTHRTRRWGPARHCDHPSHGIGPVGEPLPARPMDQGASPVGRIPGGTPDRPSSSDTVD